MSASTFSEYSFSWRMPRWMTQRSLQVAPMGTSCTRATEVIRVRLDVDTVTFDTRTPLHLLATSQARHGVGMQPVKSAGLALAVEALAAGTNCENKVGHFQRAELCSLMLCMYLSAYIYMYMDTYMRGTVVVVLLLVVMKLSASGATLTALPW